MNAGPEDTRRRTGSASMSVHARDRRDQPGCNPLARSSVNAHARDRLLRGRAVRRYRVGVRAREVSSPQPCERYPARPGEEAEPQARRSGAREPGRQRARGSWARSRIHRACRKPCTKTGLWCLHPFLPEPSPSTRPPGRDDMVFSPYYGGRTPGPPGNLAARDSPRRPTTGEIPGGIE